MQGYVMPAVIALLLSAPMLWRLDLAPPGPHLEARVGPTEDLRPARVGPKPRAEGETIHLFAAVPAEPQAGGLMGTRLWVRPSEETPPGRPAAAGRP